MSGNECGGEDTLKDIQSAEHDPPDSQPDRDVTPGARNLNGVSTNEIASTIPNQTNTIPPAIAGPGGLNETLVR